MSVTEIADDLFLSIRTVESHLSAAYRKLGVRSRTQLAAVLAAGRGDRALRPKFLARARAMFRGSTDS